MVTRLASGPAKSLRVMTDSRAGGYPRTLRDDAKMHGGKRGIAEIAHENRWPILVNESPTVQYASGLVYMAICHCPENAHMIA